jgi:putative ABC transport system permease protein
VSTLNFNTFSQVTFDFQVGPWLLLEGVGWALLIGTIGGLFPAIRAARMPAVEALRTS